MGTSKSSFCKILLAYLFGSLLITSCQGEIRTDTAQPELKIIIAGTRTLVSLPPTQTITPDTKTPMTSTVTPEPLGSIEPTETSTLTQQSWVSSLPPGQYVVFHDAQQGKPGFKYYSHRGHQRFVFSPMEWTGYISLNDTGSRIAFTAHPFMGYSNDTILIFNQDDQSITEISQDCRFPDWSPDESQIAAVCEEDYMDRLHVISMEDGQHLIPLPIRDEDTNEGPWYGWITNPNWSPDGRWIAFNFTVGDAERHPDDGIYLLDTACLEEISTCPEKVRGPFFKDRGWIYGISSTWSPDSRFLAVHETSLDSIHIIDVYNRTERVFISENGLGEVFGLAWSPDGEWLAYNHPISTQGHGVFFGLFLISISTKEIQLFYSGGDFVDGWITIPSVFEVGSIFVITSQGVNLNVRQDPSLASPGLIKLMAGDQVTILEGFIESDGYNWWKIRTDEGIEGWAVNIPEWYELVP